MSLKTMSQIPPDIKEVYVRMFSSSQQPDTIYPMLYERIVHDGSEEILDELMKHASRIREAIRTIRDRIRTNTIVEQSKDDQPKIVASDAGNNGVDLRIAFVPMYGAAAVLTKGWDTLEEPITKAGGFEVWATQGRRAIRESLLALKLQFEITVAAIEKWTPELVLFDGTIVIHHELEAVARRVFKKDLLETVRALVEMLAVCVKRKIPIVGFVKRTRKDTLARTLGVRNIRDTALLNSILKKGQYTTPIEDKTGNQRVTKLIEDVKKQGCDIPDFENTFRFHLSYVRSGYTTPFRLAVPDFCVNQLALVASSIYTACYDSGLPFAIQQADQFTKMPVQVANLRTMTIYSRALDMVKQGGLNAEDLELLALQIGEQWKL